MTKLFELPRNDKFVKVIRTRHEVKRKALEKKIKAQMQSKLLGFKKQLGGKKAPNISESTHRVAFSVARS